MKAPDYGKGRKELQPAATLAFFFSAHHPPPLTAFSQLLFDREQNVAFCNTPVGDDPS